MDGKQYLFYRPGEWSSSRHEFHCDEDAVARASKLAFLNQQEIRVYRLELVATVEMKAHQEEFYDSLIVYPKKP